MENIIKTDVYHKANKFPVHWKSQIPKSYKRNAINGDLYRLWRISSNFYPKKNEIRNKYSSARYLMRFVNRVINDLENKEHDPMTPNYLFNDFEFKPIFLIDVNEKVSK